MKNGQFDPNFLSFYLPTAFSLNSIPGFIFMQQFCKTKRVTWLLPLIKSIFTCNEKNYEKIKKYLPKISIHSFHSQKKWSIWPPKVPHFMNCFLLKFDNWLTFRWVKKWEIHGKKKRWDDEKWSPNKVRLAGTRSSKSDLSENQWAKRRRKNQQNAQSLLRLLKNRFILHHHPKKRHVSLLLAKLICFVFAPIFALKEKKK